MAEEKTEKKKSVKNGKGEKKAEKKIEKKPGKKVDAKKTETKRKPELTIEAKAEPAKEKTESKKRGRGAIVLAVIITFIITTMLFGMAFFVFMNLDVIDDNGRVRIEHGRIFVDNRHGSNCIDEINNDKDDDSDKTDEKTDEKSSKKDDEKSSTDSGELITNPNSRVTVKGAQLIEVGDLELYLPRAFEASKTNGNGKYVFSLVDDEGWADVKIYAEKTTADLLSYMQKKDSLLRLTDSAYYMNGTSWVEMESGSSTAYGTRLGDMLYVVIINIKLESDVTGEAEQMIPKTIHLKRIYK